MGVGDGTLCRSPYYRFLYPTTGEVANATGLCTMASRNIRLCAKKRNLFTNAQTFVNVTILIQFQMKLVKKTLRPIHYF